MEEHNLYEWGRIEEGAFCTKFIRKSDHEAAIKEAVEKAVKEKSTECTILNQQITMLHAEYGKRIAELEGGQRAGRGGGMIPMSALSSVLEALYSCAIEGNEEAIRLIELRKSDPKEFYAELLKGGYIKE